MNSDTTPVISVKPGRMDDQQAPHPAAKDDKTVKLPRNPDAATPSSQGELKSLYKIVNRIGVGGMGVVFLAQDRKLGRYVAVKRLNRTSLLDPKLKERFLREAKAIAALNHIHIVHIYSLGEDQEGPYIIMEYIPGPIEDDASPSPARPFTLADSVTKNGPLPLNDAIDFMIKIARAVEYAHNAGVIHRDLKPSNILLDSSWEPKIVDFGLARIFGEEEHNITLTGDRMLSLGYGAPEQESDASLADARADVYGLGALTYFAITGKNPRYFRDKDLPEVLRMTVNKALQTDVTKRWQTAGDFLGSLLALRSPTTVDASSSRVTWRCKWCDTFNPVSVKYCGECGWDGSELCPECGFETRVGIQFCPNCGIDVRDYDMALHLYAYLERHFNEKNYSRIIESADKISGFKPAGRNGRKLIDKIREMNDKATAIIKKGETLSRNIAAQMTERNYELARDLIHEHNSLTGTVKFSKELKRIPEMIRKRDMKRVLEAQAAGQWLDVKKLSENILRNASSNDQSALNLLKAARRHLVREKLYGILWGLALAILLYLASFPPAVKYSRPGSRIPVFYKPASAMYKTATLSGIFNNYAELWKINPVLLTNPGSISQNSTAAIDISSLQEFVELRSKYIMEMDRLKTQNEQLLLELPQEYLEDLGVILKKMQDAGDYDGWVIVNSELERMENYGDMPVEVYPDDPPPLQALKDKNLKAIDEAAFAYHKNIVKVSEAYISQLTNLQKKLTKDGEMNKASAVNIEIRKIKESPIVYEAQMAITAREMERAAAEGSTQKTLPK